MQTDTKSKASKKGKSAKIKGASFERLVANYLAAVWSSARRGIGQARAAGEVPDVDGTPFWPEIKHRKVVNVYAALRQALAATDGRMPVAIWRKDREGINASMLAADYGVMVTSFRVGLPLRKDTQIEVLVRPDKLPLIVTMPLKDFLALGSAWDANGEYRKSEKPEESL
jgi:hypothetical protein